MREDTVIGDTPTITLWQSRVWVIYKNDENTILNIEKIRKLSAELIDLLDTHKGTRVEMGWEIARVYANAQTEIEWACMWAIKAVTK